MKTLITGGAGFIGSNFIYYELIHSGDEILCVDKLTYKELGGMPETTFEEGISYGPVVPGP